MSETDLFIGRPLDSVGEKRLERGQIVHATVVANREADDASSGMRSNPDNRMRSFEFH
jgi:hypothetical protein